MSCNSQVEFDPTSRTALGGMGATVVNQSFPQVQNLATAITMQGVLLLCQALC